MNPVSTKWELCLLPRAGCCLTLLNVEVNEGGGDRRVVLLLETHVSVRKVDRRVLATDIDAELGLMTCDWHRIGQMTRQFIPKQSYTGAYSNSSMWHQ